MKSRMSTETPRATSGKRELRSGFSTGTAATAAARAAVRHRLSGEAPKVVAVRLPSDCYLPIPIRESHLEVSGAWASVTKDGGDDPDVTHRAEVRARVRCISYPEDFPSSPVSPTPWKIRNGAASKKSSGIRLIAGEGVGTVTKAGLPVGIGEPAINPVPRRMLVRNLTEELRAFDFFHQAYAGERDPWLPPSKSHVFLPLELQTLEDLSNPVLLEVRIEVVHGAELARHTLNPRLGILGGISILGTTGIVRPFSHQAYEETIQAALSVAASNGCREVVLSTGGKSELFARRTLPQLPPEAFVQIADFFSFSVQEARKMAFGGLVHSVFFGKVVKMAQGHACTHAHKVALDLNPLARRAREEGCETGFCESLAAANTARHALDLLLERRATGVIQGVARQALAQSQRLAGSHMAVRLLLFDYDGTLLADETS